MADFEKARRLMKEFQGGLRAKHFFDDSAILNDTQTASEFVELNDHVTRLRANDIGPAIKKS